jgi:hypothetical protein
MITAMEQLFAAITRLTIRDPGQAVRDTTQMALLWAICVVLALTVWATLVVGVILGLSRVVGTLPAIFLAAGLILLSGMAVLMLIRKRARIARAERQARARARQILLASAMTTLPDVKMKHAAMVALGLVALSLLSKDKKPDPDDPE